MPSIYNKDSSFASNENIAYFKTIIKPSTAFHEDAPKSNESIFRAHVPKETKKIAMPRNEDHGWGDHIARTKMTPRMHTTPFNNKIKGDPSTQFRCPPAGNPGRSKADDPNEIDPRSDFSIRVKKLIDALKAMLPNSPDLFFLHALYHALGN
jgi:hypothetical protein